MRLSWRGCAAIFAVATVLGAGAFIFAQRSAPDLLRCEPSLAGTEYYRVRFGIDYATQLDRLVPGQRLFANGDMKGRLAGSFLIEWPGPPGGLQTGDFAVRIVDLVIDEADGSSAWGTAAPPLVLGMRLDESCRITLTPTSEESAEEPRWIPRLISLMTFTVPERQLSAWKAEHEDNVGAYQASYRLDATGSDGQVINRRKEGYLQVSEANQAQGLVPRIIESHSVGRFKRGGRWLQQIEGVDDVSLLHEGRAVVQTRVKYSVQRMEDGFVWRPRDAVATKVASDDGTSAGDDVARYAGRSDASRRQTAAIPGPEGIDVLSDASLEKLGVPAALALLVDALRANPALTYTLRDAIYAGSFSRDGAPLAFLALQQAGTEEAFGVLVELIENEGATSITRSRAVYALAAARPDSTEVVQILASQLARSGADRTLTGHSALLAMGMMVDRIEGENDPTKALLRQLIGDRLSHAGGQDARRAALAASYNAGDAALYPLVTPYLRDGSPSVRKLAVETIGRSDAPSARSDLIRHYSRERDGGVRAATLNALTDLSRGQNAGAFADADIAWVAFALSTEPDTQARGAMIRFLGANADHGAAQRALAAQARIEMNPELLKQIGQVLSPEELARLRRNP